MTDDEPIEAVARWICPSKEHCGACQLEAKALLADVRPHIERQALERAAAKCNDFDAPVSDSDFVNGQATAAQQIRAAIRALMPEVPS